MNLQKRARLRTLAETKAKQIKFGQRGVIEAPPSRGPRSGCGAHLSKRPKTVSNSAFNQSAPLTGSFQIGFIWATKGILTPRGFVWPDVSLATSVRCGVPRHRREWRPGPFSLQPHVDVRLAAIPPVVHVIVMRREGPHVVTLLVGLDVIDTTSTQCHTWSDGGELGMHVAASHTTQFRYIF